VDSVTNLDRWATVHVEEVWSDDDLEEWIHVRGSIYPPQDPFGIFATVSSGDKSYSTGSRYLFFPAIRDGHLFDDECGATVLWDQSLEALRPATAHPPAPGPMPTSIPWLPLLAGGVVLGAVVLVFLRRTLFR